MPIRIRKLVGAVALILLVTVWSLTAMAVAQFPMFENRLLAGAYYVIAGMAWILPAMPIISWMSRPDAPVG